MEYILQVQMIIAIIYSQSDLFYDMAPDKILTKAVFKIECLS